MKFQLYNGNKIIAYYEKTFQKHLSTLSVAHKASTYTTSLLMSTSSSTDSHYWSFFPKDELNELPSTF